MNAMTLSAEVSTKKTSIIAYIVSKMVTSLDFSMTHTITIMEVITE